MKIAIIGATGFVGKHLVKEALLRNHEVTAISRNPEPAAAEPGVRLSLVKADVMDRAGLVRVLKGHDAVISAYNAGWANPDIHPDFISGSLAIQEAVKQSGVNRLIVVGGAGSLYVAPGVQLVDTPDFPAEYKPGAAAARDYLDMLKKEASLDWTFFSPAIEMHQGVTTGRSAKYRIGKDEPVFDEQGRSVLSVEDLAVVLLEETEHPAHIRQRFTAAY
jgi:putative NADH-flavin reductase